MKLPIVVLELRTKKKEEEAAKDIQAEFPLFLGLGRVKTRPEIWPVVSVFLKTWNVPGIFLENQR